MSVDLAAGSSSKLFTRILFILLTAAVFGLLINSRLRTDSDWRPAHLLLIALFCGVLFYPILSHTSRIGTSFVKVTEYLQRVREKNAASLTDVLREFPGTYQLYWQNNSILSKHFIHLNALVKIYLLRVSPNPNIALGKNGFFFEGYGDRKVEQGIVEQFDNIADYMGMYPFSELELWKWKQTLEERSYWLKQQGIEYVFVLAPTKALVYPEFLPDSLQKLAKGTRRYEQLSSYLRENAQVHFVDLLPALLEEKKKRDYPLLFYKTDFHWNFYGSLVAYQEIIRKMERFFPDYPLDPVLLDDFTVKIDEHWAHHRFMNMIGLPEQLHKNEHYLTMVPKPGTPLYGLADLPPEGIHDVYPPKSAITNSRGESMQIRTVCNPAAPIPSILLLGDSFMEKAVYYFSAHAQKVFNRRTVVNFPHEVFSYEKPTFVIQEILNMFLLRPPPENLSGIRQPYLEAVFHSSPPAVPERIGKDNVIRTLSSNGLHVAIRMPVQNRRGKASGYIIKITLSAPEDTRADFTLRLQLADGKEIAWATERINGSETSLYAAVPSFVQAQELLLNREQKNGKKISVRTVEFRCLTEKRK
ncbi:MAG: alginate O-acetyltransferase AlgX-related protein [Candidatus Electrothrix sp. YB6]